MKKLFYTLIGLLAFANACTDDTDDSYVVYPFSVQLVYPGDSDYTAVEGVKVHLVNTLANVAFDTVTNAAGRADFLVPQGLYEVSVTDARSEGGVATIFNGLKSNITVTKSWNADTPPVELALTLSRAGQVIIKELYVGGCQKSDGSGLFQSDKYVILYNNSAHEASLDSLAFGMIYPYNASGDDYINEGGDLSYATAGWLPAGSGFWYFKSSLTLAPGAQVVVSINGAIDNTVTYSNSVNLANAAYYCMYDLAAFTNTLYYPTPSEVIPSSHYLGAYRFAAGNAWVLSANSPAFIIFSPKGTSLAAFVSNPDSKDPDSGETLTRLKLPADWIVDGIEVYRTGNYENNKRLTPAIDAGHVYLINGQGYTLYRNVDVAATTAIEGNAAKLVYGYSLGTTDVEGTTDPSGIDAEASIRAGARIIYKDTNNSSNDFHLRRISSLK
jgi:hypothetical protein